MDLIIDVKFYKGIIVSWYDIYLYVYFSTQADAQRHQTSGGCLPCSILFTFHV